MPLSVNVGLSRKASKDYQSSGCSINVTAELDQTLLAQPDELQKRIDALYAQAESALSRQAQRAAADPRDRRGPDESPSAASRHPDLGRNGGAGRDYDAGGRRSSNGGRMTESQRRAIDAISGRLGLDPRLESRGVTGCELQDLSVRQASRLIDHLQAVPPDRRGSR